MEKVITKFGNPTTMVMMIVAVVVESLLTITVEVQMTIIVVHLEVVATEVEAEEGETMDTDKEEAGVAEEEETPLITHKKQKLQQGTILMATSIWKVVMLEKLLKDTTRISGLKKEAAVAVPTKNMAPLEIPLNNGTS